MARWNGKEWEFPWPNIGDGSPAVLADLGDGLAFYGHYGTSLQPGYGRWRNGSWESIGVHNSTSTALLAVYDDGTGPALYAAGGFTTIGGIQSVGFARWRNGAWEALKSPLNADASWLFVFDDGQGSKLYLQGGNLRRWGGDHWTVVGSPSSSGLVAHNDMLIFDDGRGSAIYLMGSFSSYGGVSASRIVRYDGTTWEALGAGLSMGEARRMAAMPTAQGPSLFAFGYFQRAGAGVVNGTARWVGCPNCYANADLSVHAPVLNVDDFVAFTQKYAARDPYANCNVDAVIDANDFACFLQKFAGGCGR